MDTANFTLSNDLATLTSEVVAAYVSKNSVTPADLPSLIASVHASLSGLGTPSVEAKPETKASPAEIRRSVKPDGLVSFVDGKSYKTLKRHLAVNGLTPADYRAKYSLPADYPMTAASYSEARSALAKSAGLGQVRRNQTAAETADVAEPVTEAAPAKKAGRPRRAKTG